MNDPKLCVLTRITDSSDPCWDENITIVDTLEGLRARFNLSRGVPFGWRLLRGKAARRHLERGLRQEARYQKQEAAKLAGIGRN
jgi:hypothetical protein